MKQITKLLFETEKKKNILESKVSAAKKALAKAQAALTDSKGGKAKSTRSRLQAQTKGLKSKKQSERKNSVTVSKKKFDNEKEEDEWQDAEDDEDEDEREVWDDDDDEDNEEVEKEIEGKQSVEQEDGRSDGGGWDTVDDNVGQGHLLRCMCSMSMTVCKRFATQPALLLLATATERMIYNMLKAVMKITMCLRTCFVYQCLGKRNGRLLGFLRKEIVLREWKDNAAPSEDNILGSVDDGRFTRRQRRKTEK